MSTLKVTHLQNESNSAPSISISSAVGGGVTFAGISTFYNSIRLGTDIEGHTSADDLTIATSGDTGMTIRSGTSNQGSLYFSDATSGGGEYAGWLRYSHQDSNMTIGVAENEKLRITSGGLVGVGNDNPTYKVSVKDTKADGTGVQMHLWNNSVDNTAGNVWSGIRFTGSTGDYETAEIKGWRKHPGTNLNSLSINTGGVERMVLSSSGVGVSCNPSHPFEVHSDSGTNIVAKSTNGNGGFLNYSGLASNGTTTFSVNHNGTIYTSSGLSFGTFSSPVTSKTLDDYEEGTWTPVIKSGSNTISYTGGDHRFYYTKIGNLVTATFALNGAVTSGTTGGGFKIEGLPFLSKNISNLRTIGTLVNYYGSGLRASAWPNFVHLDSNSTTVDIYTKTSASGNYDRDTVGNVGSDTYVQWQITYETDS